MTTVNKTVFQMMRKPRSRATHDTALVVWNRLNFWKMCKWGWKVQCVVYIIQIKFN